jgi:transcriptional regulator with XRE-family HTH domain
MQTTVLQRDAAAIHSGTRWVPATVRIGLEMRRLRRTLSGVSQEAFADRIGMHRAYYGALERGEKNLQLSTLARVAVGLKVPVWQILQGADV